jgi:WD40 repeat protein
VVFGSDGHTLASVGIEPVVRLWNLDTGTLLAVLDRHTDGLNALAFSPDGLTLASAGVDAAILWPLDTGAAERQLCQTLSGLVIDQEWTRVGSDHGPPPRC